MINYDTSYASFIVCIGFMQEADKALWDNNNYRLAIEKWNREHQKHELLPNPHHRWRWFYWMQHCLVLLAGGNMSPLWITFRAKE